MEAQALEFVISDPDRYVAAILACMAIGAILGVIETSTITPMKRVPYFVNLALVYLLIGFIEYLSVLTEPAIRHGYFAALFGTILLIPALSGFFLTRISIARSRDAYDTGRWAFLAYVPLLNFILLFKQSSALNRQAPSEGSRLLSGPTGIATGLGIIVFSMLISAAIPTDHYNTSPTTMASNGTDARPTDAASETYIVDYLEQVAKASNENLPRRIDEVTVIDRVEAPGTTLTRFYEVERPEFAPNSDFEAAVRRGICANEQLRRMLSEGITIVERYTP